MINLNFHWAWIPIIALIIIGIWFFNKQSNDSDQFGLGTAFGCFGCILCFLVALVLGGIFIW